MEEGGLEKGIVGSGTQGYEREPDICNLFYFKTNYFMSCQKAK